MIKTEKYKQIIIVRNDLKLGIGKIASQVAHASIGSMRLVEKNIIKKWENEGAKKVVLKADLNELKEVEKKLKKDKIPYFLVRDAGLTQVAPGTITALGIGPIEENKIDNITGKLKLF